MTESVLARLEWAQVVPVVVIDDAADAPALGRALVSGGLPIIEVTLRTSAALDAIASLVSEAPDLLVGAGSILHVEQLRDARAAGAHFGVAPGVRPEVVRAARQAELPFVPGVMTPSEVLTAVEAGATHLKFFPAVAAGGSTTLNAVAAPFAQVGVRFMPTGGITPDQVSHYLALEQVFAVGGTWIAPRSDIAGGRWPEIERRAAEVKDLVPSRSRKDPA